VPDEPAPPRIGEVLVAMLATTPAAVDAALERQRESGRNLGDELIDAGDVSSTSVSVAARIQVTAASGAVVEAARMTLDRAFAKTSEAVEAMRAAAAEGRDAAADVG
jgi:hypothetical protein